MSNARLTKTSTSQKSRWVVRLGVCGAIVWLGWYYLTPRPLATGQAAYDRRAWDQAEAEARKRLKEHPDDREAWQLLARTQGRRGRDAEALAIYRRRVGLNNMAAEDHVIAASGLSRSGQIDQARLALDKAKATDPNHAEMLHDLAKLDGSTDRLAEAAELAQRLTTRPGWEAKGWLLLGQIHEKLDDPSATVNAIQRALQLDPKPADSSMPAFVNQKRLARTSLRVGRPDDAVKVLEALPEQVSDFETAWLFSRAYIQKGDFVAAKASLNRAGGKEHRDPTLPEPAPFVGSEKCAECHKSIFETHQLSRHTQSFHKTADLHALKLFEGQFVDPADKRVRHEIHRDNDTLQWKTNDDKRIRRAVVQYAFGSGGVAITMVGHDEVGDSRELRLSRYGHEGIWDVTTGHLQHPDDRREFLGRPLFRNGIRRCLECHTTNAHVASERSGPAAADRGIGCERCHGPGANHLNAIAGNFEDIAIGRPKLATAQQVTSLCGSCHSPKDFQLTPNHHLAPRFAAPSMAWSRCYTESLGSLSCINCHDPHGNAQTSASFYESRCLACHSKGSPEPIQLQLATGRTQIFPKGVGRTPCTVNPVKGCIDCHMPKIHGIVPHTGFTDHRIRIRQEISDSH